MDNFLPVNAIFMGISNGISDLDFQPFFGEFLQRVADSKEPHSLIRSLETKPLTFKSTPLPVNPKLQIGLHTEQN